jgi:hypothetical protein
LHAWRTSRGSGRLTFANAAKRGGKMKAQTQPRVIVLDNAIPDIVHTAPVMLTEAEQSQRARGVA